MSLYTFVTAKLAEEILNQNTFNRPLRPGVVEKYTRLMLTEKWRKNGSTIVRRPDGTLYDGQHRLFAIIEAASQDPAFKGVWMIMVNDAEEDSLATIDTGLPRSFGDFKKLEANGSGHSFPYANQVAATARLVYWYENLWPKLGFRTSKVSHQELDEILQKHPMLAEHVGDVFSKDKVRRLGAGTVTAFVYGMGATTYPNEAAAWLELLRSGDAPKANPAIVLRQQLIDKALAGKVLDVGTRLAWLIKSWNAFARTEDIGRIRWGIDEPLPAIFGTQQYTGKLSAQTVIKETQKRVATATDLSPQQKGSVKRLGVRRRPYGRRVP